MAAVSKQQVGSTLSAGPEAACTADAAMLSKEQLARQPAPVSTASRLGQLPDGAHAVPLTVALDKLTLSGSGHRVRVKQEQGRPPKRNLSFPMPMSPFAEYLLTARFWHLAQLS